MTPISLDEMALDPSKVPGWEGVGRRWRRKKSSVVSEGSSRKLRGCLPSILIYLPAAGRPGVGMTRTQEPAQAKRGVGAKLDGCSQNPQTGFS